VQPHRYTTTLSLEIPFFYIYIIIIISNHKINANFWNCEIICRRVAN